MAKIGGLLELSSICTILAKHAYHEAERKLLCRAPADWAKVPRVATGSQTEALQLGLGKGW